jgi:hypothetical protein
MDSDDEEVGSVSALGLGNILASAGIDVSGEGFSSLFNKTGGSSKQQLLDIGSGDEDGYEDDLDLDETPEEQEANRRAKEREEAVRQAEEDKWVRRAMADQASQGQGRKAGPGVREKDEKQRKKERDEKRAMEIWPEFRQGTTLKMSEIWYETPAARVARQVALERKKKRKLEPATECELLFNPFCIKVGRPADRI